MSTVTVQHLGEVPYRDARELQRQLVVERAAGRIPDTLLFLTHPPVITLGRRASRAHLLASGTELERRGVEVIETDRGGDITFHGPGQLIGYPIIDLTARGRDLHRYLRDVEGVLIRALAGFGLTGERQPGCTGVWVGGEKVAAIGVRVARWVACHGFALNIETDLSYFDLIVPCGLAGRRVTSLAALLGRAPAMDSVQAAVASAWAEEFAAPLEVAA
ncbi:MAG: lipoyl(octanoyl) transferase LipB [Gemmatimonadota bacterium]